MDAPGEAEEKQKEEEEESGEELTRDSKFSLSRIYVKHSIRRA